MGLPEWNEHSGCLWGVQVIVQQQERLAKGSQQWLPEDFAQFSFE